MTTKARESEPVKPAEVQKPPETKAPETVAERPALADPVALARETPDGMCAVDDGTAHYGDGRAIPGTRVCSAHEINYTRDGLLRRAR